MLVQITVQVGAGPVQHMTADVTESAQELEEESLQLLQRVGQVIARVIRRIQ